MSVNGQRRYLITDVAMKPEAQGLHIMDELSKVDKVTHFSPKNNPLFCVCVLCVEIILADHYAWPRGGKHVSAYKRKRGVLVD